MRYTVFVILLVFFSCCLEQVKEPSEKTQTKKENVLCPHCNIVLISIETTRADHLGLYGYGRETTPVIDSLGSVSTVYENAYAQAPWTRTSIASLMTSRYPRHHGVLDTSKESVLDESLITLPEVFKANGYATGAVVTHSNLKSEFGFNQGFDYFNERMLDWPAGNVLLESLQWVNKTREPFFLWIHLSDPHGHYTPPKPYEDLFSRHEEGLILPQNTHKNAVLKRIEAGNLSKKDIERMIGLYDSEIRYTDDSLGAFLATLKQLGLGEDTIVVLTADHGEEFFDHDGFEHGHTLYRELIRVPLIINSPGLGNKRITHPVELIDIYPLLLDLTGLEITHTLEGESLLAENYSKKVVYSETDMHAKLSMVRDGSVKVIHNWETDETLVFNLDVDLGEKNPIKPDNQTRKKYLDMINLFRENPFTPKATSNVSEETMQRLKDAGYVI